MTVLIEGCPAPALAPAPGLAVGPGPPTPTWAPAAGWSPNSNPPKSCMPGEGGKVGGNVGWVHKKRVVRWLVGWFIRRVVWVDSPFNGRVRIRVRVEVQRKGRVNLQSQACRHVCRVGESS